MKKCPLDEAEINIIEEAKILLEEEYDGDYQKVDIRHHMKGLLAYFCFNERKGLRGHELSAVRRMNRLVLKTQGKIQDKKES